MCGRFTQTRPAREVAHGRTGVAQDSSFHAALANSAHNRAISRIVNALMDLLTQSREESLQTPGRPERSHQDHRRILDAIRRRDWQQARLRHARHRSRATAEILTLLQQTRLGRF